MTDERPHSDLDGLQKRIDGALDKGGFSQALLALHFVSALS